jgi:hypothetical protein
MINYPSNKVSVLVANVLNGPDTKVNEGWKTVIDQAIAKNKVVIGYVRTGYLGVSQQKFKTMLGSTQLEDWVAQIETDVELWYRYCPQSRLQSPLSPFVPVSLSESQFKLASSFSTLSHSTDSDR